MVLYFTETSPGTPLPPEMRSSELSEAGHAMVVPTGVPLGQRAAPPLLLKTRWVHPPPPGESFPPREKKKEAFISAPKTRSPLIRHHVPGAPSAGTTRVMNLAEYVNGLIHRQVAGPF